MFYNEKTVYKGRKDKRCDRCGCTIKIGTSHVVFPDEMCESSYTLCNECSAEASKLGVEEVDTKEFSQFMGFYK